MMVFWNHFKVIISGVPLFCVAFGLLYLSKLIYDLTTPFSVEATLVKEDNPAFGVHFFGYMLGVSIAILGSMSHLSGHLKTDLTSLILGGGLSVVLVRLSITINDKLILSRFKIYKEILEDRNIGTGAVVAGSSIASGLIINGILSGESPDAYSAFKAVIFFFIAGQIMLIIASRVLQKITNYDISDTLEKQDNLAVGINYGAFLLGIGIILRSGIAGASRGIMDELIVFLVYGIVGLALLSASQVIADRIFLPSSALMDEVSRQQNPAAALVAAACYLSIACFIGALV
ncbi:MAG: DUF350 domain-containing protein [bacterium]